MPEKPQEQRWREIAVWRLSSWDGLIRDPSLEGFLVLAKECYQEQGLGVPLDEPPFSEEVLDALITISWEARKAQRDPFFKGIVLGLVGEQIHWVPPPFMNQGLVSPWMELTDFIEKVPEDKLSQNARALGLLFMVYHMLEGIIGPAWNMITYHIRLYSGEKIKIEDCLFDKEKRWLQFSDSYNNLKDAIPPLKERPDYERIEKGLRELLCSTSRKKEIGHHHVSLVDLRNAIAHHDFIIQDGEVKLQWIHYGREGKPGHHLIIPPYLFEQNLLDWKKLVNILIAWENTFHAFYNLSLAKR